MSNDVDENSQNCSVGVCSMRVSTLENYENVISILWIRTWVACIVSSEFSFS